MILGIFEYAVLLLYAIIFIPSYDSCHIWSGHIIQLWDRCDTLHSLICFLFLKGNFPPCCGVLPCIAQGSICSRCSAELLRRFRNLFLTSKQLRWENTGIHQGRMILLFSCHHHSNASKQKEPNHTLKNVDPGTKPFSSCKDLSLYASAAHFSMPFLRLMSSKAEETNSPNFVIGRNSSSNFCATATATTCQKTRGNSKCQYNAHGGTFGMTHMRRVFYLL